jgi:nucleolin
MAFTAFVGNLDFATEPRDLEEFFKGLRIAQVRIMSHNDSGKPKGYGYVDFADDGSLSQAIARGGGTCKGRVVRVDRAAERGARAAPGGEDRQQQQGGFNGRGRGGGVQRQAGREGVRPELPPPDVAPFTAYVGNIPFSTGEADVANLFQGLPIVEVRLPVNRDSGQPKGYAYVEFGTKEALIAALGYSGTDFNGRTLRVNVDGGPPQRTAAY